MEVVDLVLGIQTEDDVEGKSVSQNRKLRAEEKAKFDREGGLLLERLHSFSLLKALTPYLSEICRDFNLCLRLIQCLSQSEVRLVSIFIESVEEMLR